VLRQLVRTSVEEGEQRLYLMEREEGKAVGEAGPLVGQRAEEEV